MTNSPQGLPRAPAWHFCLVALEATTLLDSDKGQIKGENLDKFFVLILNKTSDILKIMIL